QIHGEIVKLRNEKSNINLTKEIQTNQIKDEQVSEIKELDFKEFNSLNKSINDWKKIIEKWLDMINDKNEVLIEEEIEEILLLLLIVYILLMI
ncbi:19032_t:CDS:1, partial [Funneliformis geosporum]